MLVGIIRTNGPIYRRARHAENRPRVARGTFRTNIGANTDGLLNPNSLLDLGDLAICKSVLLRWAFAQTRDPPARSL